MKTTSRLTFGIHKGKRLIDCPIQYLKWMAANLKDGDFYQWAVLAEQICRDQQQNDQHADLERMADEILRRHGCDPHKM